MDEVGRAGVAVAILVLILLLIGVALFLLVPTLGTKFGGIVLICIAAMVGGAYARLRSRACY